MEAPEPVEALARELQDVAFTFAHSMPDWDNLPPRTREWFRGRAARMIQEGWQLNASPANDAQ